MGTVKAPIRDISPKHALRRSVALRAAVVAGAAYAGTLVLIFLTGVTWNANGPSFATLALASVAVLFLAPMAALVAAMTTVAPYRDERLDRSGRTVLGWALLIVALAATVVALEIGWPQSAMISLLGGAGLVLLRAWMIEHEQRHGPKGVTFPRT